MVRQFEQQRNQDLCLLVDLWQPENPSPRTWPDVELAVSFAATIVSDRCRRAGSYLITGTATQTASLSKGPASNALLQEVMHKPGRGGALVGQPACVESAGHGAGRNPHRHQHGARQHAAGGSVPSAVCRSLDRSAKEGPLETNPDDRRQQS